MKSYLKEIDEKMNDYQKLLDRSIEGKNVLEKMIAFKDTVGRFNDIYEMNLYVEIDGLMNIDPRNIDTVNIYSEEMIKEKLDDSKEVYDSYIKELDSFIDKLNENNLPFTDVVIGSDNNGLFMKYEKYMEGLFRLWKAEFIDEKNMAFPLTEFHREQSEFLKSLTSDDFYSDVVKIKANIFAFDDELWDKRGDELSLEEKLVHFNDFVSNINDGLNVYYDCDLPMEDIPFENILLYQKLGLFDQHFDIVCDDLDNYKSKKRLVK